MSFVYFCIREWRHSPIKVDHKELYMRPEFFWPSIDPFLPDYALSLCPWPTQYNVRDSTLAVFTMST